MKLIANALKDFGVCYEQSFGINLHFGVIKYYFKQSITLNVLLLYALDWKLSKFENVLEFGKNVTPIYVTLILSTAKKYRVIIPWPPSKKAKSEIFV